MFRFEGCAICPTLALLLFLLLLQLEASLLPPDPLPAPPPLLLCEDHAVLPRCVHSGVGFRSLLTLCILLTLIFILIVLVIFIGSQLLAVFPAGGLRDIDTFIIIIVIIVVVVVFLTVHSLIGASRGRRGVVPVAGRAGPDAGGLVTAGPRHGLTVAVIVVVVVVVSQVLLVAALLLVPDERHDIVQGEACLTVAANQEVLLLLHWGYTIHTHALHNVWCGVCTIHTHMLHNVCVGYAQYTHTYVTHCLWCKAI